MILVKIDSNYADEFDTHGFSIMSLILILLVLNKPLLVLLVLILVIVIGKYGVILL